MQSLIPKPSKTARSPPKDDENDNAIAASPEVGDDDDKPEANDNVNGKGNKEEAISKSNNSKAATVELANEYIKKMQKDSAAQSAEVEKLKRENEALRRELEQSRRKIGELESRNKFMGDQVWDLRRLIKRVGREGYLQIVEVEKEHKRLEDDFEALQLSHRCLQANSETFERCIAYWRDVINPDEPRR